MLEKIKNNATAVLLVLSFGIGSYSAWSVSWIKVLKEKNHRLMQNNHQLMVRNSEYSYLVLGKDEFITDISSKYDSVLNQLKIKPKEVIRYIQRDVHNYIHDTVIISVLKNKKIGGLW